MGKKLTILFAFVFCYFFSKSQTADFTFSTLNGLFCAPQLVTFTQNCTGTPRAFIWKFGNGNVGTNPIESNTYLSTGTYTVTLTAVYADIAIEVSKTIIINASPTISIMADKIKMCKPEQVNFSSSGSSFITSYQWNFGDGSPIQTTTLGAVSHTFLGFNTYNVTVKGITDYGCNASASIPIRIEKFAVSGFASPDNGCIPIISLLTVNPTFSAGDGLRSVSWVFGDGSPNVTRNTNFINHTYNISTPIFAKATITSNQGCTNEFIFDTLAFGIPLTPVAYTVPKQDTFCGSEFVKFYGYAANADFYNWDFNDGGTLSTKDTLVNHKFTELGDKYVTVTPSFNGCLGNKDTVKVYIKGVIAGLDFANTCADKKTYFFTNRSLGTVSHFEWSFSDAASFKDSVNYDVSHTFPQVGSFVTKLFVADSITGCKDSTSVNIYTANPVFTSNINAVCRDSLIIYRVLNSYPPGAGYKYEYHVNDTVITSFKDSLYFYPKNYGIYNDTVIISDNYPGTCSDSLQLNNIKVQGPVLAFNTPTNICLDSSVIILNNSYPFFSGDALIKWNWNFGDTKTDSVQKPAPHQYSNYGSYNIRLTVTDNKGCAQALNKPITINQLPKVVILPDSAAICKGNSVVLMGFSTDSLIWTPNTFISCNTCDTILASPPFTTTYTANAINKFGCKGFDTTFIKVYQPFDLVVSPSDTSICPNMPVQFKLNFAGITAWAPSTYLNDPNISNPLSIPGTSINYRVVVKDSIGCFTDTVNAYIKVTPNPIVETGPDQYLPFGNAFTITPVYNSNIRAYVWDPPTTLNCTNCATPTGTVLKTQSYTIKIIDKNGCKAEDSLTIFPLCENNIFLPNVFTPNNDGLNDYFYPITANYGFIKSFAIFNRQGEKVFERKNFSPNSPLLGWNGSVKGNEHISSQVFVWIMESDCSYEEATIITKGTVLLIR